MLTVHENLNYVTDQDIKRC